jgi:hypothetical protein
MFRGTTPDLSSSRTTVCANMISFSDAEASMQDINPIVSQINDLKGRTQSLRGYL